MTGDHDGSGGTSGRDGAEPTGPRTVPLDDLFGVTPSGADAPDPPAIRTVDPTGDEPGEPAAEPSSVPGWDTSPHQVSFATLSGTDGSPPTITDPSAARPTDPAADAATDGVAEPAPVRRLTFDDPAPGPAAGSGTDGGGDGSGAPRVVSFEELSGRGTHRGGARRDRATPRRRPTTAAAVTGAGTAAATTTPHAAADLSRSTGPAGPGTEATGTEKTGAASRGRRRGEGRGRGSRRSEERTPRVETPQEQESRARDICLRLLTDRARTVKELGDALRRKEIPDEVAHRVLERFDEVGLVDDQAFAEQWVRSRHRHRGLGKRAIAMELHRKGVDREIADEALTGIDDASERDRARELVVRRLRSLPVGSREERQSSARKLVGMLARKGYGPGVAYGVVKEEIAAAGADADELGEAPPED
ncbi:Regulatory protein RecX [Pseudonocardia sp. Ae406_Ps2]|uniref:regulatory protein RecX n=1 Tax=unclassified Pseudonocardia TaxID=2619320 RepID=UPI00094B7117|nr:Regulatory protein RecX [Pseudonocardia sp. Ae331_Ps2]OLM05683.1 Regulatory protein RecX [Pseudonocardia sp. Ae406_Ps2]OLM15160.1 Regulatory protein RecX [Pseudonocardia sp. Ae505_Ps2]OLM27258.1 Regulatory protein RecX [Pseudonocardia sp. Ae706_Ps2]OLM30429.1 Regulatory protein RecX [Pseudonocardia sp. Ae717_Ps2]